MRLNKAKWVWMSLNESEWVWMSLNESQIRHKRLIKSSSIILLHDRSRKYWREHSQKSHTNEKSHARRALMVWKPFQTGFLFEWVLLKANKNGSSFKYKSKCFCGNSLKLFYKRLNIQNRPRKNLHGFSMSEPKWLKKISLYNNAMLYV